MFTIEGSRPRYQILAAHLREEIENGLYPVGSLMPPEVDISARFNVSRSTVREAIRRLQVAGLVSRRPGVGTRIESNSPIAIYSQLGSSIEELVENANEIRLDVLKMEDVVSDAKLAERLGCGAQLRFLRLEGTVLPATPRNGKQPFYWVEIYVAEQYMGIRDHIARHRGLVASLIEKQYQEPILEIRQQVTATKTGRRLANILRVAPDAPALRFQRWYYTRDNRLAQVTISVRPAERFTYCTSLKRSTG